MQHFVMYSVDASDPLSMKLGMAKKKVKKCSVSGLIKILMSPCFESETQPPEVMIPYLLHVNS